MSVQKNAVEFLVVDALRRFAAVARGQNLVAESLQQLLQHLKNVRVVIHEQ